MNGLKEKAEAVRDWIAIFTFFVVAFFFIGLIAIGVLR